MILYTVRHMLILRLLMCYQFQSVAVIHNLLFLVSAASSEEQTLAFYDFIRRRSGAYSSSLQRIIDDLKAEKLVEEKENCLQITEKGRHIYTQLGASLKTFSRFWDLCFGLMEHYQGDAEHIKQRVFYDITFRRVKIGERIFDYCMF
ncbi:MAG TPA: hypothetical protein GXX59_03325 [Syntrophomonadaceae bacterium]|nr:hypothetical protein [Syntrophomonadaceae bacterium]